MAEKILVIDHEKDNRDILGSVLKKEGYHVKTTGDGEKAMDLLRSDSFDLVILDIKTPGINSLEAIGQIKELDAGLEVIVLTGHATIENAVKSLRDNGACDFMSKPLESMDQLLKAVKKALHSRDLIKEKGSLLNRLKEIAEELDSILNRLSRNE